MIERDAAQPEIVPQPLPAGKSKNLRPRARPLKRGKAQAQVTPSSPLPPQQVGQIQPDASGAATVEIAESVPASPPTQGVENENSDKDTPLLSHKRPSSTLHQLDYADKRQKILDRSQSKAAETMNRSAAVRGNTS